MSKLFKILLGLIGIHYEYTVERSNTSNYSCAETKTVTSTTKKAKMSQGKIEIKVNGKVVWEGDSGSVEVTGPESKQSGVNVSGNYYSSVTTSQTVVNGRVISSSSTPAINVEVNGDVAGNVSGFTTVNVTGNVSGDADAGTDLTCGDVGGSARAGTDLRAKNVQGDVRGGTDVNCGDVTGNVDAGMSVRCGKVQGKVKAGMNINMG